MKICESSEKCKIFNCPHIEASESHLVEQADPLAINDCNVPCDVRGGIKGSRCIEVNT